MFSRITMLTLAAVTGLTAPVVAGGNKPAQAATGNIVGAAASSANHKTLVAAVKAAGLVNTLASRGPFTVFAPTDAAFAKLPAGTVDTLLQPANREQLKAVLTYHVVAGQMTTSKLMEMINAGGGSANLNTVPGRPPQSRHRRWQGHHHGCKRRHRGCNPGRPHPIEWRYPRYPRGCRLTREGAGRALSLRRPGIFHDQIKSIRRN